MIPYLDLKNETKEIKSEILKTVSDVIDSGQYILGKQTESFEIEFAKLCNTNYAVGVGSGLDALSLILMAYDIGPGDEVILPANSFIATALAVTKVNAKIILCDCDPDSYLLTADTIKPHLTKKTKAIIPVHLFGQPCQMDEIIKLADQHNCIVIEDAAQAHGATNKDRTCGSLGNIAAFSFYPTKNIGALGDGGAITTNDQKIYQKLKKLRNYGSSQKYYHQLLGENSRLDEIQAAILKIKLPLNQKNIDKKTILANTYLKILNKEKLKTPKIHNNIKHAWHIFSIQTNQRDNIIHTLEKNKIGYNIHYPIPIHLQECYSYLNYKKGDFPNTEKQATTSISLPLNISLSTEKIEYISNLINEKI